jgi:hypothetical protein
VPAIILAVSLMIVSGCAVNVRGERRPLIKVQPLTGDLELEAEYRRDNEVNPMVTRRAKMIAFREQLTLGTEGDVYHPDLLSYGGSLGLGLVQQFFEFNEFSDDTFKGLNEYNVNMQLLRAKPYPLTAYASKVEDLLPRQFLGSLNVETKNVGADLAINSPDWPMILQWSRMEMKQNPLGTLEEDEFTQLQRDFFRQDSENLSYSLAHEFNEYSYLKFDYNRDDVTRRRLTDTTTNDRSRYRLSHDLLFGDEHQHRLESTVDYLDESGNINLEDLRGEEHLKLQHTPDFSTNYKLNYLETQRNATTREEVRGSVGFNHQLYKSLASSANAFASRSTFDTGGEQERRGGSMSLNYKKTNPWGLLVSSYSANYIKSEFSGRADHGIVIDEERIFTDPFPIMLDKFGIDVESIVITDETGLDIYEEGDDYTISFIEGRVQLNVTTLGVNLPNISDGQLLLIDYEFSAEPERERTSLFQSFRIREYFKSGLSVYYLHSERDDDIRSNVSTASEDDTQTDTFGTEYQKDKLLLLGEYSKTQSTVSPFDSILLRARHTWQLSPRTTAILRASQQWLDYTGIDDRDVRLFRAEGRLFTRLSSRFRISGDIAYRDESDSNAGPTKGFSLSSEMRYIYRQFQFTTGLEYDLLERRSSDRDSTYIYFKIKRFF